MRLMYSYDINSVFAGVTTKIEISITFRSSKVLRLMYSKKKSQMIFSQVLNRQQWWIYFFLSNLQKRNIFNAYIIHLCL